MDTGLAERSMRVLIRDADEARADRDRLLEIVRALANVYTVETDQIAVLALVARARQVTDEIQEATK